MQQYFYDGQLSIEDIVSLSDDEKHHIQRVLRMRENSIVRLIDNNQQAFLTEVVYKDNDCFLRVIEQDMINNERKIPVTLVCGLLKKESWDLVLQKATELGVTTIVPFISSRCVVKLSDEKENRKKQRWNKICQEASEQSKRNAIPNVVDVIKFNEIPHFKSDCNVVAYELLNNSTKRLRDTISGPSITVVIGPEGGFSADEVEYLYECGFNGISLGKRILRAETAPMYVLSAIDALLE